MFASQFGYITAGLYWVLTLCWLIILLFYWREYRRMTALSPMVATMLVVVFLDGARTLLENLYFGTAFTARTGMLPTALFDTLNEPQYVLLPKMLNLLSALMILAVLLRRWFPNMKAEIERQRETAKLYEELQEAHAEATAAQEARDALTHMIVHDMRTPLTSVITGLQTVQHLEETSDLGEELVGGALSGANRLLTMVNALLDISKMESGEMVMNTEVFPVGEVMQEATELVEALLREKNIQLKRELDFPTGTGSVNADREKTRRVLVNLLGNAIKFTPEDGTITLRARPASDGSIEISVRDTGPGIAAEHQARIFDKFYQVEPGAKRGTEATGLGLTFCKMAVEASGGHIGVESAPGKGSRFWFTLPAEDPARHADTALASRGRP